MVTGAKLRRVAALGSHGDIDGHAVPKAPPVLDNDNAAPR